MEMSTIRKERKRINLRPEKLRQTSYTSTSITLALHNSSTNILHQLHKSLRFAVLFLLFVIMQFVLVPHAKRSARVVRNGGRGRNTANGQRQQAMI